MYFEMYKQGFLNAFSIGFIPKEYTDRNNADGSTTRVFTKSELLEISAVPVPANPNALVLARAYAQKMAGKEKEVAEKVVKEMEEGFENKAVVPYKDHGMVQNMDAPWDGPAQMAACGEDMMKVKEISAWYHPEKPRPKNP